MAGERADTPTGGWGDPEQVAWCTERIGKLEARLAGEAADDPEDRLAPVGPQLDWMRGAGFVEVECVWRWRGVALLVGETPAA